MCIQEKIDKYIKGELSPNQVDDLWIEFIKTPHWYEYFITELHLTALIRGEGSF
jgi:hypothetical protein